MLEQATALVQAIITALDGKPAPVKCVISNTLTSPGHLVELPNVGLVLFLLPYQWVLIRDNWHGIDTALTDPLKDIPVSTNPNDVLPLLLRSLGSTPIPIPLNPEETDHA